MAQLQYELGELDQMSDIMGQLMDNPQYAELWGQLQQGFDPMVGQQLRNLPGLQQQILGGGFFGDEEEEIFKNLMSGQTLAGQGGALYDLIQEQYGPARGQSRDYASSMGLAPTSGEAMSMTGNVMGQQDRAFAEQMANKYMQMVGMGTQGLGQMGGEQLQRQQTAGGLGQWLSQFVEGSQQGRMNLGLGITQAQQAPLMNILGMHQQRRDTMKPPKWQTALDALGTIAPYMMGGGAGAAASGAGTMYDFTDLGQGGSLFA